MSAQYTEWPVIPLLDFVFSDSTGIFQDEKARVHTQILKLAIVTAKGGPNETRARDLVFDGNFFGSGSVSL